MPMRRVGNLAPLPRNATFQISWPSAS